MKGVIGIIATSYDASTGLFQFQFMMLRYLMRHFNAENCILFFFVNFSIYCFASAKQPPLMLSFMSSLETKKKKQIYI